MLHAFGIAPEVLATPMDAAYLLDQMGVPTGRMVAAYPTRKRWRGMVKAELDKHPMGDRARKAVLERVLKASREKTVAVGGAYDEKLDWTANADAAPRTDFCAIIAEGRQCSTVQAIKVADIVANANHPSWAISREARVEKAAEPTAEYVSVLLRNSRQVFLVDPHFDPTKSRYHAILEAFAARALQAGSVPPSLEVHCLEDDKRPSTAQFQRECERWLPRLLPTGATLTVIRWHQREFGQRFHARYLLTERGGYRFEYGLDETEGSTHDVSLLDDSVWSAAMKDLDPAQSRFDKADTTTVTGTKR